MIRMIPEAKKMRRLLDDIFTPSFMQENTNFDDFMFFRFSSAVFVSWDAEELIYDDERLDGFVNESTKFANWDEMVKTAVSLRYN